MKITVAYYSKHPHTTKWLKFEHPVDADLSVIIGDLEKIGWERSPYPPPSPLNGMTETSVSKPGSDIFEGWTESERRTFARQANAVLKRHGFRDVPHNRLTLQDCI